MGDAPSAAVLKDVLDTVERALQEHHEDRRRRAADSSGVSLHQVGAGVTVDLSYKHIETLPEELISIVRDEISRLALSHNRLTDLPFRLTECSNLQYLNVRHNHLRRLPEAIFYLPALEVLDVSKNKIESLPEDLTRLNKLRLVSLRNNRISRLPMCLAQMNNLQRIIINDNPITFPPPEIWKPLLDDSPGQGSNKDTDNGLTLKIKEYLRTEQARERTRRGEAELSEGHVETPRPTRRKVSGRFPIKPSVSSTDLNGALPPAPLGPSRNPPAPFKIGASVPYGPQSAAPRPGLTPLIVNNERYRSNSESQMASTLRQKRMGMPPPGRSPQDTPRFDVKRTSRLSHYRGLSHASALHGNVSTESSHDSSSPTSPVEKEYHRSGVSMRRLSSLQENKRESHFPDAVIKVASGILFSMHQLQSPVENIARITRRSGAKRSSLERMCYSTWGFVQKLDRHLMKYETQSEESESDDLRNSRTTIQSICEDCIKAFAQVAAEIRRDVPKLVMQGDRRYLRSLMLQLYGSQMELRNACFNVGLSVSNLPSDTRDTPTSDYQQSSPRSWVASTRRTRRDTAIHDRGPSFADITEAPTKPPSLINGAPWTGRLTPMTSISVTPPRSDEPFQSIGSAPTSFSRSNTLLEIDETEEDRVFENIFMKLSTAMKIADRALLGCKYLFAKYRDIANSRGASAIELSSWQRACNRCEITIDAADVLRARMATLQIRDPPMRNHLEFWQLSKSFCEAFTNLAVEAKTVSQYSHSVAQDVKHLLKHLRNTVKEVVKATDESPWQNLFMSPAQSAQPMSSTQSSLFLTSSPHYTASIASSHSAASSGYVTPLPATPLSAALGPAAQATVPVSSFEGGPTYFTSAVSDRLDKSINSTLRR